MSHKYESSPSSLWQVGEIHVVAFILAHDDFVIFMNASGQSLEIARIRQISPAGVCDGVRGAVN